MADVVGGGTTNVTLYDENGNLLGTAENPVYTVPASLLGRLRTGVVKPGHTMAADALDTAHFYMAEAPQGTATSASGWNGVRIAKDLATGTPTGAWQFASNFIWNDRASVAWT